MTRQKMDRSAVTTLVKANGGTLIIRSANHAAYKIPMSEAEFIKFRRLIPFQILWVTGTKTEQEFNVFFDSLAEADGWYIPEEMPDTSAGILVLGGAVMVVCILTFTVVVMFMNSG